MSVTTTTAPPDVLRERGARVVPVPPPIYYGAGFAAAMLLRSATVPLTLGARPTTTIIGAVVVAGGMALALGGILAVARHRTTMVPHHPVSSLVTTGAYRLSRNPMYAGLAIVYLGGAFLAGSWWPIGTLPIVLLIIRHVVIGPEEMYLASRFGDVYSRYRADVRRWL